ncbi:ABC transporter-like protein [Glonium stellatum]|uniref:ABC transporter-like protein n=1 Tax=Glonium stellatum TaxID=574774 RepID=A0A8E2F4T3_9PEZI|nr:ABC transporter-like protein [Glonium stellatum]
MPLLTLWPVIAAVVGLVLTLFASGPAFANFVQISRHRYKRLSEDQLYADKDGVATEESQAKLSSVRIQTTILLISSLAGASLALSSAVCEDSRRSTKYDYTKALEWLNFSALFFIVVQSTVIALTKDSLCRFRLAINSAAAQAILIVTTCTQQNVWGLDRSHRDFVIGEIIVLLIGFCTCLTFPRRPEVYHAGKVVDGQRSVSTIMRLSYSWCTPLLALAASQGHLNMEDLPAMDHETRSKELHDSFNKKGRKGKLVKLVLISHAPAIILQHVITLVEAAMAFVPQYCFFKLLKALEDQSHDASTRNTAIIWAAILGMSMLLRNFTGTYMWFISRNLVHIPIRVQLSALVFAKSMRRKDVKGVQNAQSVADITNDQCSMVTAGGGSEAVAHNEPEEDLHKTRQGTINLVGFDAARVSEATIYQNMFVLVLGKMATSFTFLGLLIGWQALLSGIAGQFLIFPLNARYAKMYSGAQTELMSARDKKLAVLNEALSGIRQIKLSALENRWQARILEAREQELATIWAGYYADCFLIFSWVLGPVLLSAICISTYALMHGSISASVAFTTISILAQIQADMTWIPELIMHVIEAWISLDRIEAYLNAPEKTDCIVPGDGISFRNAKIAWPSDDAVNEGTFVLRDLNLEFPNNELSIISGRTGSGKSLLLAAILGEVDLLGGSIVVPRAPSVQDRHDAKANSSNWIIPSVLAFVSQQPWIENRTFRDNVLFGLPYDENRYRKVLSACALDQDLHLLTDGDMTEIGANGINLSGGQRWRITLARALYSRAGILVMDDIFSAVDAHVGRHLLENAIAGELGQNRTRIIVTHHVSLCLPQTKYAVHVGEATVDHAGLVNELEKRGELREVLKEEEEAVSEEEDYIPLAAQKLAKKGTLSISAAHEQRRTSVSKEHVRRSSRLSHRRPSTLSSRSHEIDDGELLVGLKAPPKKFVEEETKQAGRVSLSVYHQYMVAAGGPWLWCGVVALFALYEVGYLGQYFWVAVWTRSYGVKDAILRITSAAYPFQALTAPSFHLEIMDPELRYYLFVYFGIALFLCIEGSLRYTIVYWSSVNASRKLFHDFTYAVLRAPLRWFDTVPLGRILNRFTSDFKVIDSELGLAISMVLNFGLRVVGITAAGAMVSPYVIVFALILFVVNSRFAFHFMHGARETKRLESVTKSPVFEIFGTALAGVSTIRAFSKTEVYINNMFQKIDDHGASIWYMWLLNQWLAFRLGVLGAAFTAGIALLVALVKNIGAPLAGFALTFTLQYSDSVMWVLRQYATVEQGMNATERILEYSELPIEDPSGADAPAAWPTEGRLEVTDLVISYAPDLPPVLKGLTFSVEPNERVGVVGRTGAGKSSLTLALFRFLQARQGSIVIDGIDISTIKLRDLRSRLAIIPQDPVLFSGTIRSNLDPFDEHSDSELQEALQRVHLIPSSPSSPTIASSSSFTAVDVEPGEEYQSNINPFTSLSTPIAESGQNLSQGQRQLLCLARAILSRPKLLVLDEATSAVDKATDELIQRSIRDEFKNTTLIVIAHRLSTIADFDRILVMGEGKVVEYGTPRELLEKGGAFGELVGKSGEEELLREIIFSGER